MKTRVISEEGFTVAELIEILQKMPPDAPVNAMGKSDAIAVVEFYGDTVDIGDTRDL